MRHVREAVRFADGVRALADAGVTAFVELGPDGVLSGMARESLSDAVVMVPVLRKDRLEELSAVTALSQLHVHGFSVDWDGYLDGTGAVRVDLPTYAFQHQPFWPGVATGGAEAVAIGLTSAGHPLLNVMVELAHGEGMLFAGRLSVQSHPWLADHAVMGRVLLPGTALLELAFRAGDEVGCDRVEELTLAAPLVLPERGAVRTQVRVGVADGSGRRTVTVHSRPESETEEPWTQHAMGVLAVGEQPDSTCDFDATVWPPEGAEPIDLDGFYDDRAAEGFAYGPVFQGLRRAWRRESLGGAVSGTNGGEVVSEIFAEVGLPEALRTDAEAFGLHPALLDAGLHAAWLSDSGVGIDSASQPQAGVPFSWSGVSLQAAGASAVRVRLTRGADGSVSIAVADPTGAPVASVESLAMRALTGDALSVDGLPGGVLPGGVPSDGGLFGLDWVPVRAGVSGSVVVVGPDPFGLGVPVC
ncbi:polyketide synthase dehydratase domain-containing protein, partial [Streptomyces sp. NPDC087850]|uniref:polyketide synthase dehydratase domain-containing protein n=1 Tax=Streptomyces sp. NPDC087850 TaxID=3365809 RepID=UPI003805A779